MHREKTKNEENGNYVGKYKICYRHFFFLIPSLNFFLKDKRFYKAGVSRLVLSKASQQVFQPQRRYGTSVHCTPRAVARVWLWTARKCASLTASSATLSTKPAAHRPESVSSSHKARTLMPCCWDCKIQKCSMHVTVIANSGEEKEVYWMTVSTFYQSPVNTAWGEEWEWH